MVNSPCKLTSYRLLPTWVLVTITDPDADTWEVVHEPSHSYWKNVPSNAVLVVVVVVVALATELNNNTDHTTTTTPATRARHGHGTILTSCRLLRHHCDTVYH